jgi:hypothetical protein
MSCSYARNLDDKTVKEMEHINLDVAAWNRYQDGTNTRLNYVLDGLTRLPAVPDVIVPILVGETACGFFLLWNETGQTCTRDELLSLRMAADIIARKITADSESNKTRFLAEYRNGQAEADRTLSFTAPLKSRVSSMLDIISKIIPAEFLSIVVLHPDTDGYDSLTATPNRSTQVKAGLHLTDDARMQLDILRSGQACDIDSHPAATEWKGGLIPEGAENKSILIFPLVRENRTVGVTLIATEEEKAYHRRDELLFRSMLPAITETVTKERQRIIDKARARQFSLSAGYFEELACASHGEERIDVAARFLIEGLKVDAVRISTIDDSNLFLDSRSLKTGSDLMCQTPSCGSLILSVLPLHQQVLQYGEVVVGNRAGSINRGVVGLATVEGKYGKSLKPEELAIAKNIINGLAASWSEEKDEHVPGDFGEGKPVTKPQTGSKLVLKNKGTAVKQDHSPTFRGNFADKVQLSRLTRPAEEQLANLTEAESR